MPVDYEKLARSIGREERRGPSLLRCGRIGSLELVWSSVGGKVRLLLPLKVTPEVEIDKVLME